MPAGSDPRGRLNMPTLAQSLYRYDREHLDLIAELWEIDELPAEADQAAEALAQSLRDRERIAAKIASLPAEAKAALRALVKAGGRLPWPLFSRQFGEIRSMGAVRRQREQPHRHPISVTELLFYHALLARAFFDTPSGPQEFAYLPDDLFPLLRPLFPGEESVIPALGRPARPAERAYLLPFSDGLLDDLTTLLAALRLGRDPQQETWHYPLPLMRALLEISGLTHQGKVQSEAVRAFLESSRQEALRQLQNAWLSSRTFNELSLLPHLLLEGEWKNPAWETRHLLLKFLAALPTGEWWHLPSFIQAIKEQFPDFQRPAGDYDSWFIRRRSDGAYLRGFRYWDEIEGELLRFFILQLLPALGLIERAAPSADDEIIAFRWHPAWELRPTKDGYQLELQHELPFTAEEGKIIVTSQGKLRLSSQAPRKARYLLARMAEWEGFHRGEYRYRITAHSLHRARQQGLKVEHLIHLLRQHAAGELPPNLLKALESWAQQGSQIALEEHLLLRLSDEKLAETLKRSAAARLLGEALGPKTFLVPRGNERKLNEILLTLGWFVEDRRAKSSPPHEERESPS